MPTRENSKAAEPWPGINPGSLRHKVTLQQYGIGSPLTFDEGGAVQSWSDFATVYASLEPVRSVDMLAAGQDVSKVWIVATIRYRAGVEARMRIVAPNGTYIIQAVENIQERNILLKLMCLALGANE